MMPSPFARELMRAHARNQEASTARARDVVDAQRRSTRPRILSWATLAVPWRALQARIDGSGGRPPAVETVEAARVRARDGLM